MKLPWEQILESLIAHGLLGRRLLAVLPDHTRKDKPDVVVAQAYANKRWPGALVAIAGDRLLVFEAEAKP